MSGFERRTADVLFEYNVGVRSSTHYYLAPQSLESHTIRSSDEGMHDSKIAFTNVPIDLVLHSIVR